MTPCFKVGPNEYATKHKELHQMMLDAWSPIFNCYVDTTPPCYDEFCRQFPDALLPNRQYHDANPFEVPDITAAMIAEVIAQMKPSSPGIDGWKVEELQILGMVSLDKLAILYQIIERAAKWPAHLLDVPVTALKKGKGDTPLQVRPISLTSHIYRMWAKIRWVRYTYNHGTFNGFLKNFMVVLPTDKHWTPTLLWLLTSNNLHIQTIPYSAYYMIMQNVLTTYVGKLSAVFLKILECQRPS